MQMLTKLILMTLLAFIATQEDRALLGPNVPTSRPAKGVIRMGDPPPQQSSRMNSFFKGPNVPTPRPARGVIRMGHPPPQQSSRPNPFFKDERIKRMTPRIRHSRHVEGTPRIHIIDLPEKDKLAVKDNHKPIFIDCMNYHPEVKEDQPIGTYVFTIHAVDVDPPDMGGTITYHFISTMGEKERFKVDQNTGEVTTADIFDHDEPSREKEVYITVRATDNGQPQLDDACTIKIKIVDINDNQPVFDKVTYQESVPQDLPVGRPVMRISATDIDEGNNSIVWYQLETNSPDQQYFTISKENGLIYLNKTIDKPPGYKFHLSAVVKDMGEPSLQSSINLDIVVVESNKKPPSFIEVPKEPIRLKENYSDFNKPITSIRAVSNIENEDKLQFEVVTGQTEQTNKYHTFVLELENNIAYLKLGNHLDYEKTTDYILTIRVTNNYRLAAETLVYIQVEDVNDNIPIFSEIRSGTVLENEPIGTFVMQVRAFDADGTSANNQITYELADPTDPFAIDPVTGNITTLQQFDRETRSFYNIKILATDNSESALVPGRHNIGQHVFLIEIADKNDNPPHFGRDTYVAAEIAESANINELVTQIEAKDVDTASQVTYSIIAGNTNNAFSITKHTGEIRVQSPLDYENTTTYSLDIRASDGIFEDYAKVLISVLNINDNPPVFEANYSKTIKEETKYSGCVLELKAYDPDIKDRKANQNIVYSLVKLEQKEYLSISNNGCLTVTKPLNRDPPLGFEHWQILVMAADQGGVLGSDSLRSTTEVILHLTDVNDNAPFLTNSQPVTIYENEPPGPFLTLTAKDYDSPENGPPFTFAINDSASDMDLRSKFQIQGNVLSSVVSFDREEQKEYWVPISISDSGTPRLTGVSMLHVIVGDKNDNPMAPGHSDIFVYNFKGENPDTEIGRVYVQDPDDWDTADKSFMWLPSFEERSPFFDIIRSTGMIIMKQGTPNGTYALSFNVTEQSEMIPFHYVTATVNVTVKDIPEEAVDSSGSIRLLNITAEEFITPEFDGLSKKEKLHRKLAKLYNTSLDNVDVFTVIPKVTVKDKFLDIRFSAHGSPYYSPEKLNVMVAEIKDKIEEELKLTFYMINIDECIIEKEQCESSCRNVLTKSNMPAVVYTNTTSFVGVNARIESECTCSVETPYCFNGGTQFGDKCECPEGLTGPRCELNMVGFEGNGWAMYPPLESCHQGRLSLTLRTTSEDALVFYFGPVEYEPYLKLTDFMSLEIMTGYPVLMVNYGSGTTRINNSVVSISDGQPHDIDIIFTKSTFELIVDNCRYTSCMALGAPVGLNEQLNVNAPLQLGGTNTDLERIGRYLGWEYIPISKGLSGCISNFTYNERTFNLGKPSHSYRAAPACDFTLFKAVMFVFQTKFIASVVCSIILFIVLLLLVVVHKSKKDNWTEKELDDIRENIIAYEDEGGGEGDAGYDLHVLRQMYQPPVEGDPYMSRPGYCINKLKEKFGDRKGSKAESRASHFSSAAEDTEDGEIIRQIARTGHSPPPDFDVRTIDDMDDDDSIQAMRESPHPVIICHEVQIEQVRTGESPPPVVQVRDDDDDSVQAMRESPHPVLITHEVRIEREDVDTPTPPPPPRSPRPGSYIDFLNRGCYAPGPEVQRPRQSAGGERLCRTPPPSLPWYLLPTCPLYIVPRVSRPSRPRLFPPMVFDRAMVNAAPPDISGFLDDKKSVLDRDSDLFYLDNVRHYAYEGDGNTSGSLSSLASCTDDEDLKFNYLSTFGPRFRKLADMYGDSEEERTGPHEESWC